MNTKTIWAFTKDFIIPVIVVIIPFSTTIYDALTEPELHFIYQATYGKNPVIEWNRQVAKLMKQLETATPDHQPPPESLLRAIGKEIYSALPVMASGIGFKPFDKMTVRITNLSTVDLRNIRVQFNGCEEYDSYETWPDNIGHIDNSNLKTMVKKDSVTIKYNLIQRTPSREYNNAYVTFYGADASNCKPTVYAETAKGTIPRRPPKLPHLWPLQNPPPPGCEIAA